ncbi:MAG: thiol-activated cytolysin, partial [Anaerolineae bacterium]|nr:thiol-activated cytolysin [Anaerolineae bacterium]NIQ80904.1 thiol-activated cytolysin [Anaerolineae bacterium]
NGSEGVFQQVEEVRQSTIVQAINDIIRANEQDVFPARFTYTSSQVTSHQHMALELGVNYQTLGFKFKSNLAFSTDRDYNRFLVQFNQSFYTVSFDLPSSLDDLFAPEVTAEDLATYVGPGNPPTYISSVTYGRRFFLLVESTSSAMDMQASIKASYDAAVSEGAIDLEAAYVNTLENVNIKVFALG